ncbi:hypothetical protein JCM24511_04268, partial [Saitozyma sp. JCM 24511]
CYHLGLEGRSNSWDPPSHFTLKECARLDDLSSTLGLERLILAYLDNIYMVSNDPNVLEDMQSFFPSRQPSIHLNLAKNKTVAVQEPREHDLGDLIPLEVRAVR